MAKKFWIKLWVEMLGDPKVAMLPDDLYRKFIEVLLMAGKQDDNGMLPPMEQMSWMLHLPSQEVEAYLIALSHTDLVHKDGNEWVVTKFSERQETSAAGRMRKMRAKNKDSEQLQRNSDGNSYTHDSTSTSTSVNLIKLYESEIGTATPYMQQTLQEAWDTYPHEWFQVAFSEAGNYNKRNWRYIEAILKRWKTDGFQSRNGKGGGKQKDGIRRTGVLDRARQEIAEEEARKRGDQD